ncbi:MAG: 3-oxoacyl-[acyl-carrier protein] reductase [Acidimicrobiaceae bacterium]|nr:3-oxoacyl-[acyl-carrier protein] reductase [Acidimicrobiaceae bacterium]
MSMHGGDGRSPEQAHDLVSEPSGLHGRVAVVTGVSRRQGIGFAIARRLLADGAAVVVHSWAAHDAEQPWGADPGDPEALLAELTETGGLLAHVEADFLDATAPATVVATALERFGAVDILVSNHARSSRQSLEELTASELDASWAVNARATVLLAQSFAARHDDQRTGGRIVLLTSGQHLGPMPGELPYAMTKGATHQLTASLADHLAGRRITVNSVNPGPTDTGWASPVTAARIRSAMPFGRWGTPDDAARLVRWLVSDEAQWITGQVINSEGGYRRAASQPRPDRIPPQPSDR